MIKKNVYHIVIKTDFNKLNYWDTLIEILLERFIIRKPYDKGKDIDKFKDKRIITYLIILKKNTYEIFDWEWDKNITLDIKEEIKTSIVKYFSEYNMDLFRYYQYIKFHEKWKGKGCNTPLDFMKNEFVDIEYIRDLYQTLITNFKKEKEKVKILTNNENEYSSLLKQNIENSCDSYLGLNIKYDTEDEW